MKIVKQFGNVTMELESDTQIGLVDEIIKHNDVFGNDKCGKCNSDNISFTRRDVDGDIYYEIRCNKCGAKLALSQHREGNTLYPKRKAGKNDSTGLEKGEWLPDGGWVKWDKELQKEV